MARKSLLSSFQSTGHQHEACVDLALKAADEKCAALGVRLTPIRRRVLEIVWARHEPVGAYEILDRLRQDKSNAAPPTVYRALDFLLEHGLVHRIESLNAFIGCGEPTRSHTGQFLICETCGIVGEMDDPDIEALLRRKAGGLGFDVRHQTIEVRGLCPACRTASSGEPDA